MSRARILQVACLAVVTAGVAHAQSFSGTFTAPNRVGGALTLTLQQNGQQVSGSLAGNGAYFQVNAQVDARGYLIGTAVNQQGALYVAAVPEGASLRVTLAEYSGGQVDQNSAQQIVMSRVAGGAPGMAAPGAAGAMGAAPGARGPVDPYVGTFVGPELSVTLQRAGNGYQGVATYQGMQLPLAAQVQGGYLQGVYQADGQQYPMQAVVQGDVMQLAAGGQTFTLQRQGSGAAGGAMAPGAPGMGAGGGAAPGAGVVGSGPQDRQIAQLLLSSRWCSFSYSTSSGTTRTETVVFSPDGWVVQQSGAETYSSGAYGTVSGQHGGGDRARWRIQNGMLMLSQDGVNWVPQQLQISRNSSGHPIVTSAGTEYSQC